MPPQNASPASAPAAAPTADAATSSTSGASAPAAAAGSGTQVLDARSTVVDARLWLQGPSVWPFDARTQDALVSALASVMTVVPRSAISVVAVAQVR
jgi:hypothetical protein